VCEISSVNYIIVNRKFHAAIAISGDCEKIHSIIVKSRDCIEIIFFGTIKFNFLKFLYLKF